MRRTRCICELRSKTQPTLEQIDSTNLTIQFTKIASESVNEWREGVKEREEEGGREREGEGGRGRGREGEGGRKSGGSKREGGRAEVVRGREEERR